MLPRPHRPRRQLVSADVAEVLICLSKKMRSKYAMADGKDGRGKEPREPLFAATDAWVEALGSRPFLGGVRSPSLCSAQ